MNFKKQPFGFMDMLRFKKMVPTRRRMLAEGENKPLPQEYRTNTLAKKLHPGYMQVELTAARPLLRSSCISSQPPWDAFWDSFSSCRWDWITSS